MSANRSVLVLALVMLSTALSTAQSGVSITSAYAREITVDGQADPSGEAIVIYDTSFEAETRIGEGAIARDGTFAAVVQPALIEAHRLVAVDKNGRRSAAFVVRPARSGSVPSAPNSSPTRTDESPALFRQETWR
jgi:hypothetical protein